MVKIAFFGLENWEIKEFKKSLKGKLLFFKNFNRDVKKVKNVEIIGIFIYDHITKNQKYDINFLINIEKKYNIELWKLSINERFFYQFNPFHRFSSDEILSILEQECRLFEDILDKVKPDFLIDM